MKTTTIFFMVALVGLTMCKQVPQDDAVEYVAVNGKDIPVIWPEKITTEKSLRFTDLFEDIELVELESHELSMIKYVFRQFVGKDYIIISSNECGIIHFDRDGRFVKVLAKIGKGPGEVADPNRNMFVDEENDWVYVVDKDVNNKKLLAIHIPDGEHKYIPFANTGNEYSIRDAFAIDNKLYCTTMSVRGSKSDNPIFCQTLDGELLWEYKYTHPLGLTDGGLSLVDGDLYFNYYFAGDTIYKVVDEGIVPVLAVSSERSRAYPEEEKGDIYLGGRFMAPHLFRGDFSYVEDLRLDERYGYERPVYSDRTGFIFDLDKKETYLFGQMENDYLGWNERFYLQIQHNGLAVAEYPAIDLYSNADSIAQLPDIDPELKKRLKHIVQTVNPEANPYLLISRLKKKNQSRN